MSAGRSPSAARVASLLAALLLGPRCTSADEAAPRGASATASASPNALPAASRSGAPTTTGAAGGDPDAGDTGGRADDAVARAGDAGARVGDAGAPAGGKGCPADMVLVAGDYCPGPSHQCAEVHEEYEREQKRLEKRKEQGQAVGRSTVSERCLRYRSPAVCVSKKRRPMRFCMDRYEWPNQKGALPPTLVSWHGAVAACKSIGKRLCTADEFNFACEGEEMRPYPYGFERDARKCNIDRPYVRRTEKLLEWDACMKSPACKAEFEKLDQRVPAGSMPECVSPFGVYDITGNVNEWVERPGEKPPHRSGLKGGWWGPVRCRCRPMTTIHPEHDYGYEQGFRCCKDADPH